MGPVVKLEDLTPQERRELEDLEAALRSQELILGNMSRNIRTQQSYVEGARQDVTDYVNKLYAKYGDTLQSDETTTS